MSQNEREKKKDHKSDLIVEHIRIPLSSLKSRKDPMIIVTKERKHIKAKRRHSTIINRYRLKSKRIETTKHTVYSTGRVFSSILQSIKKKKKKKKTRCQLLSVIFLQKYVQSSV
jgi:hypothetical protein